MTALVRDLSVFSGVNAALFVLVVAASFVAPLSSGHARRLVLWLVLAATVLSVIGYVFLQNWFFAIVTGQFVGFGYIAWVGVVLLALGDWALNRGRATRAAVDLVGGVVGAVS